jgi:hypothetical protein
MGSILSSFFTGAPDILKSTVLQEAHGDYSVRVYDPYISAKTMASVSSNDAFRRLASYIGVWQTAANGEHKRIGMTAPVLMTQNVNGTRTMEFVLPFELNEQHIPMPTVADVYIEHMPKSKWVVVTLPRGMGLRIWNEVKAQSVILAEKLKVYGFKLSGAWRLAIYKSPWDLWQLNDIHFHLLN